MKPDLSAMRDGLAGISVAGLLLPSAIAYAAIAGLSPDHAIIATIIGLGVYALFGRSRFAMVAPTSSSAAILAALILSVQREMPQSAQVAEAAVLLAGGCFLAAGALRAGALASFISRPVLGGFTFGIALTITIRQIPAIAGVHVTSPGSGGVLPMLWRLLVSVPHWQPVSVGIGVVALGALTLLRRVRGLPASALVLAAGVLLSALIDLPAYHVALVGKLAIALPMPSLPRFSFDDWSRILQLSVPLFLILFAESWGSIRSLALRNGDKVEANRELLALGCANLAAGLFQGMPVGAGFSASSAAEAAGAKTRLAGVATMAVMLALSLWGKGLVALLPSPVLACVVIASLFHALNPAPLIRLWRIRRDELVATAAAIAVLALGVLDGMLIAVGLSIVALLQRFSGARLARLGQIAGTHDFVDLARNADAQTVPGTLILRPEEPLFFANAERVLAAVAAQAEADPAIKTVILSLEESPDFDSTALDALLECAARLERSGRILLLARVKEHIKDVLQTAGASQLVASCFWSVADAAAAAVRQSKDDDGKLVRVGGVEPPRA
jgi:MFS superfamily sulfate permease-like transporter